MLKLSFSRLLVDVLENKPTSEIYMPVDEQECLIGKVIAVGDGRHPDSGKIIPMDVELDDVVMFSAHVGEKLEQGLLMNESDVLGIVG